MRGPFVAFIKPACPVTVSTEDLELCLDIAAWNELVGGEGA